VRSTGYPSAATNFVFGVRDGQLGREEIPAARRATLRTQATNLERITTQLRCHDAEPSHGPAHDAVELARRLGFPLYADDVALRQIARARAVPAFGTTDLITTLDYPTDQQTRMLRRLAAEYVVDLPLSGDDLAELQPVGEWRGPSLLTISRAQWWKRAGDDGGLDAWRAAALRAAQVSGDNLVLVTKCALQGALQACLAGMRTQRYQQVVVTALVAVHDGGVPAPDHYLDHLIAATADHVAPTARFVYHALVGALRERGVEDPHAAAGLLLPDVAHAPETWL
jgi:hypothetical protein